MTLMSDDAKSLKPFSGEGKQQTVGDHDILVAWRFFFRTEARPQVRKCLGKRNNFDGNFIVCLELCVAFRD